MTINAIGMQRLCEMQAAISDAGGNPPIVIDSDDLVARPAATMAAVSWLAHGRQQQFRFRAARTDIRLHRRELREARTVRRPSSALLRAALRTADERHALGVKRRTRPVDALRPVVADDPRDQFSRGFRLQRDCHGLVEAEPVLVGHGLVVVHMHAA
jgi:hypothetical protein